MFCGNCGTKNEDHAMFCQNCGARLDGGGVNQNLNQNQRLYGRVIVKPVA